MRIDSNLFDHTLRYLGLSGVQASFVVIGAMDGISFDEFHSHVRNYRWSGLLVEPIPEQFRRLVANYTAIGCSPDNRYENSAIAEHNGNIQMLTIHQDAVDSGKVHECFGGMSAIYPPRNGLGAAGDAETVRRYGELIEVPCITLPTLLERHRVETFDMLCIDAEGWDFRILRQLDFSRWRPKLIRIEYINLSEEEKSAVIELLELHQYYYGDGGINLDAVTVELWDRIRDQQLPVRANPSVHPAPQNLTLVTSLLPLMLDPESDPPSVYQRAHALLLSLNPAQRLILYVPPGPVELATRERNPEFTFSIRRRLEDFAAQEHYGLIHEALLKAGHAGGDLKHNALSSWLSLSAPFLLNDASLYNPFGTEHFLWVDMDLLPVLAKGLDEKLPEWSRALEQIASASRLWLRAGAAPDLEAFEPATRLWLGAPLQSLLFQSPAEPLGVPNQRSTPSMVCTTPVWTVSFGPENFAPYPKYSLWWHTPISTFVTPSAFGRADRRFRITENRQAATQMALEAVSYDDFALHKVNRRALSLESNVFANFRSQAGQDHFSILP